MSIADETKVKMVAAIDHLKQELKNLRTGRANPAVLDNVQVEVYGSQMRLKELASITAPEPRQLLVTPFDPQTAGSIGKGIERANLNLQPIQDGHIIRIQVPPMDENTRKDIVKQGKKKTEETKVAVREIRRKQNELARKAKADGDIAEDLLKKFEKQIQAHTDQYCKEADEIMSVKEKEITTV